jgi:hypothetical protein
MPETTTEEITHKAKAYKRYIDGKDLHFLKAMADIQVANFLFLRPKPIKIAW